MEDAVLDVMHSVYFSLPHTIVIRCGPVYGLFAIALPPLTNPIRITQVLTDRLGDRRLARRPCGCTREAHQGRT